MPNTSVKVIFDTNVWISFLVGKRLAAISGFISDGRITIITCQQLLQEIMLVTARPKLKKYFPKESVSELLELLETIAEHVDVKPTHFVSRDAKDNFLLDLIDVSHADYLVTGDKDLLILNPFLSAQIVTPADFEKRVKNWGA